AETPFTTELESGRMPEEFRQVQGGRSAPNPSVDDSDYGVGLTIHEGPGGIGTGRPPGPERESQESGDAPPALVGVPLLPGTGPGPSSAGRVHRRHFCGRCRCVSRGTSRTSLGKAFGREQRLGNGGGGTFFPRSRRSSDRFPSHTLLGRDRWTTN